jgi:hypothetical protein
MAGAMRELFESSEGVVAKLLRERKELNQEMMAELLKGANRDEQQQAAAAIAGIGVSKLNEYLAEKKYQRAKEKGNAEEVDPKRYSAEKQDEIKNLSKNAKMVNSFLSRNMKIPKIAEVMFSTETFVRNIIRKYNLPK